MWCGCGAGFGVNGEGGGRSGRSEKVEAQVRKGEGRMLGSHVGGRPVLGSEVRRLWSDI